MRIDGYRLGEEVQEVALKRSPVNSGAEPAMIVLKFGSSILRGPDDLPRVVAEIYRHQRNGVKVVAIVSAFDGETDRFIAEAESYGADCQSIHAPRLVSLGEDRTTALLAIACDQAGLSARVLNASDLEFRAAGHPRRADPLGVNRDVLDRALMHHDVVVAPGFVAIGEEGEPVLLGRGGSDLTAIVLASELELSEAVLLKDVDGVYDQDPAKVGGGAKRYADISYDDALEVAGELVQSKAINHAKGRKIAIQVGRLGAADDTRISQQTRAPTASFQSKPLRVALAGCGVVGTGVADLLRGQAEDFELCAVLVRDLEKLRPQSVAGAKFVSSIDALFEAKPDIVVDVLSSGEAGLTLTERALAQGVSVASANKQALADDLDRLQKLASENGVALDYSASVGGGASMIETVRRVASSSGIVRIDAIVNGTVNFILSELAAGRAFDEAVKAAQDAGFAEADPTADLSGADAVAKAKILAWEAFAQTIEAPVSHQALDEATLNQISEAPGVWRQVATIARDGTGAPVASVTYSQIEENDFFWDIAGERNAIRLTTADGDRFTAKGRGAGAVPTAHSILGDLGAIRRRSGAR